jgi:23S rRNA pseudouridine1911/1915/1917 synthase
MNINYDLKENNRLDSFLSERVTFLSRTQLAKMIKGGDVTVDGIVRKPSFQLSYGSNIDILLPRQEKLKIEPEDLGVEIVYEENDFLLVNKPQGMLSHPTGLTKSGTLVNAMLYYCKGKLSGMIGKERPGIVHRLDKGTSGLMVIAKTDFALKEFSWKFKHRTISKEYVAISKGYLSMNRIVVNAPISRDWTHRWKMAVDIDGRESVTRIEEIERLNQFTYVRTKPETGRTHQIRVHMSHIGHPILADEVYGGVDSRYPAEYPFLHCQSLMFDFKNRQYEFSVDPPSVFNEMLDRLRLTK